jgi:phosphoglycolate phosphatase
MGLVGILFDKDGTFVDIDATWGMASYEVMTVMSRGDPDAFARIVRAMHYDVATRRFRPTSPLVAGSTADYAPLWAAALGRQHDPALIAEMNERFTDESLRTLTPIGRPSETMAALHRRGLKLGLATNDAEASGRAQVAALGLDGYMDFLAGYDSGHGAKPGPGMVLAFADHLGVTPDRVALVGDSLHDMTAARAAGALAIAVLTGPADHAQLAPLAHHVIPGLADLPALIDSLGSD